jgi:nitrate reductase NapD
MSECVHISSIVVTADPSRLGLVVPAIDGLAIADVAHSEPSGKLIVTLETPDEVQMVQAMTDIQLMPGVVSAALVYHQTTTEADQAARTSEKGIDP